MGSKHVLIFIVAVFLATVSQILLKISANMEHKNKISEYINLYVISAYSMFLLSAMLAVISYRAIPLKLGPIIESIGYVFILILGNIILREKITRNHIWGNIIIIIGVIVFNL